VDTQDVSTRRAHHQYTSGQIMSAVALLKPCRPDDAAVKEPA
jgi:hypothetical protein